MNENSVLLTGLLIGLFFFIIYLVFRPKNKSNEKICKNCGSVETTKRHTPGSLAIEIVLWLTFLIPGLIYTLWRLNKRTDICGICKSKELIPLDSPIGQKLAQEYNR